MWWNSAYVLPLGCKRRWFLQSNPLCIANKPNTFAFFHLYTDADVFHLLTNIDSSSHQIDGIQSVSAPTATVSLIKLVLFLSNHHLETRTGDCEVSTVCLVANTDGLLHQIVDVNTVDLFRQIAGVELNTVDFAHQIAGVSLQIACASLQIASRSLVCALGSPVPPLELPVRPSLPPLYQRQPPGASGRSLSR